MSMTVLSLKPIAPPKTLKEMAYASIKEAILSGGMQPDQIYSEPFLSELLNISRTPVREALQDLAIEGYVRALPKRGYQVSSFQPEKIEHLYDYRMAIELAIIRQITGKLDQHQLREIERILRFDRLVEQEEEITSFVRTDRDFHRYLASLTNNPYFIDAVDRLLELIEWAATQAQNHTRRPAQATREHLDILQALKERDPAKACAAMEAHLLISKRLVLQDLAAEKARETTAGSTQPAMPG